MRAHYFEGAARSALHHARLNDMVAMAPGRNDVRHPIAALKALYGDVDAPFVEVSSVWSPQVGLLSLQLADIARRARVGASIEQLLAGELTSPQSAALQKIEEQHHAADADAPVDALIHALRTAL